MLRFIVEYEYKNETKYEQFESYHEAFMRQIQLIQYGFSPIIKGI